MVGVTASRKDWKKALKLVDEMVLHWVVLLAA